MDSPTSTVVSEGGKVTNRFDRYIRIIFHKLLTGHVLKADGVAWLHNQIVHFIDRICSEAFRYMQTSKPCRVTLMDRDMELGIFQVLPHDMREMAATFLTQTLERYDKATRVRNKTKRSGLYVSTGRCELYVRNFIGGHQIRRKVFIMVAACVEYLLTEVFHVVMRNLERGDGERVKSTTGVDEIVIVTACEGDRALASLFGLAFRSPPRSHTSSTPPDDGVSTPESCRGSSGGEDEIKEDEDVEMD